VGGGAGTLACGKALVETTTIRKQIAEVSLAAMWFISVPLLKTSVPRMLVSIDCHTQAH
jgi:hypothetical protein